MGQSLKSIKSVYLHLHAGPIFNIPSVVLTSKALPSGVCAILSFWPSAAVSQFYGILAAILQVSVRHKKEKICYFFQITSKTLRLKFIHESGTQSAWKTSDSQDWLQKGEKIKFFALNTKLPEMAILTLKPKLSL